MNATYLTSVAGNNSHQAMPASSACEFTTFEFVGYFYVLTLTCFIGTILNIINIIVFAQKCFSATAYTYMSAISLTDAITLLALLPTGLGRWVFGLVENKVIYFIYFFYFALLRSWSAVCKCTILDFMYALYSFTTQDIFLYLRIHRTRKSYLNSKHHVELICEKFMARNWGDEWKDWKGTNALFKTWVLVALNSICCVKRGGLAKRRKIIKLKFTKIKSNFDTWRFLSFTIEHFCLKIFSHWIHITILGSH